MTRTVQQGFIELSNTLAPAYSEPENAAASLAVIERCLTSAFDMSYLAPYGSTGHGTQIPGYSAIDSLAVVDNARLFKESSRSLDTFREALSSEFPDAVVTGGRPVVAVPFGDTPGEQHRVVPAYLKGSQGEYDVYGIPAPRDRWIRACPAGHSAWLNALNDELGQNLKPFVRVIKAWNHYNGEPLWSFYLELCAADFLEKDSSIVYPVDVESFFWYMLKRRLAPFEDSHGSDEAVYGTAIADKEAAKEKLLIAANLAKQARTWEQRDNISEAFYSWRKLFNWQFPAY